MSNKNCQTDDKSEKLKKASLQSKLKKVASEDKDRIYAAIIFLEQTKNQ